MVEQFYTLNTQVYCEDGKCGKLTRLAIDPESWQVADLVVEEGILLKRARVIPATRVASATPDALHLAVAAADLAGFQDYREEEIAVLPDIWNPAVVGDMAVPAGELVTQEATRYSPPPAATGTVESQKVHRGLDDNLVVVRRDTEVNGRTASLGHLDCVIANGDTGQVTGLMVRYGLLDSERVHVPARLVERLGEDAIRVAATRDELEETMNMQPTPADKPLDSDLSLTAEVGRALIEHPLTADAVIEVINERGIITLQGEVDSPEMREAAAAVSQEVPGVITVINSLQIRRDR